jgi:tRNA-dihydrouridine synthase 3
MSQKIVDNTQNDPKKLEQDDENKNDGGQNKKRPRNENPPKSEKLCRPISLGETCQFGDKCIYSHDTILFLKNKPEDIGNFCYNFNEYGICHFGLNCRYGGNHINTELGVNIIRSEVDGGVIPRNSKYVNEITKKVQTLLRKKKYPFHLNKYKKTTNTSNNNNNNKTTVIASTSTSLSNDIITGIVKHYILCNHYTNLYILFIILQ